jgi:hypothetical protein
VEDKSKRSVVREGREGKGRKAEEMAYVSRLVLFLPWTLTFRVIPCCLLPSRGILAPNLINLHCKGRWQENVASFHCSLRTT